MTEDQHRDIHLKKVSSWKTTNKQNDNGVSQNDVCQHANTYIYRTHVHTPRKVISVVTLTLKH